MLALTIQKLCSSAAFAGAATIFYKKDFGEPALPAVTALSVLGLLFDQWHRFPILAATGGIVAGATLAYNAYTNRGWMKKAAKPGFFIPILAAILDARFDLISFLGLDIPYWNNIRILLAAVPQFLRKPKKLKVRLQELRSILGPMFVLFVTTYAFALNFAETSNAGRSTLVNILSLTASISAILAGVFFRPDNPTMLNLCSSLVNVPYKTTLIERRNVHRRLMVTSFLCCMVLFAIELSYGKMIVKMDPYYLYGLGFFLSGK